MCPLTDRIARLMKADVYTAGELVVLTLGGFAISMHFVDALKVAKLLLDHGRAARQVQLGNASKLLRNFRVTGVLTNATPEKLKPARWAKKLPLLMKGSEISVRQVGIQVEVQFRKTVAGLSWDAALNISQHLRIRGREARDSIQETASWHELATSRA